MAQNPYDYMKPVSATGGQTQDLSQMMNTNMGMTNPYATGSQTSSMGNMGQYQQYQQPYAQNRGGGTPDNRNPSMGVDPNMRDPQTPINTNYPLGNQANVSNPYGQYQNMFDPTQWSNEQQATQYQRYLDNTLPLAQLQQNQYQYGADFNEAQRRFNAEMARQQGLDQYQQGLSDRQYNLADWQAQIANSQWQDQFAQTKANDAFSQGLANQQFGLQQNQQNWQQNFQTGQQAWNQNIQQQQQNNANQQTQIEQMYKAGLIDIQTAQNEIARMNYQNQFTLGNRNADITQQNYAQQFQLGQGRLGLDQTVGLGNLDLQRQKLLQDAKLAAENRASQERIAAMQASGRAQAVPTARFIANW